MKKIDKNTLMDYLYGELPEAEAAQVARYLEENPELKAEYKRLHETHAKLGQLDDEPVTEPLVFSGASAKRKSTGWQKWTAAAAIFVLGLLTAAWLDIHISFRNQELAIRFGEPQTEQVQPPNPTTVATASPVAETKIVSVQNPKPALPDSIALQQIAQLEQKLQRQIQELRKQQLALKAASAGMSSDQVASLMNELQQDNYETMQQLLLTANQQQQLYSQKMLAQLTDYLATQRTEDLQKISVVLNSIVQNTDQKQQQTDVVLNQLISKLNEKNTRQRPN